MGRVFIRVSIPYQQVLSSFHFFSAFVLKAYKKPVIFLSQTSCLLFFATRSAKYVAAKNAAPYQQVNKCNNYTWCALVDYESVSIPYQQVNKCNNSSCDGYTEYFCVSIPYQQVNKCNGDYLSLSLTTSYGFNPLSAGQ